MGSGHYDELDNNLNLCGGAQTKKAPDISVMGRFIFFIFRFSFVETLALLPNLLRLWQKNPQTLKQYDKRP